MKPDVLAAAIDAAVDAADDRPRLLMSPRGEPLGQTLVKDLATGPGVVLVCGRFEGVDERVIARRCLREVSLGDFVLSGGEPAAIALLDAIVRLLPGVMGDVASGTEESFESGLLEHASIYAPTRVRRRCDPRRSPVGRSWRHRQLETTGGGADHAGAPSGPVEPISLRQARRRLRPKDLHSRHARE